MKKAHGIKTFWRTVRWPQATQVLELALASDVTAVEAQRQAALGWKPDALMASLHARVCGFDIIEADGSVVAVVPAHTLENRL